MYRSRLLSTILLMSTLLFSATTNAEQYKSLGSFEVHYIALPSTFIQADTASKYKIKRSENNGLINISILDKKDGNKAVKSVLNGTGKNLIGQTHQLNFIEVKEGDAIYYLAEYPFTNEEIVNFTININANNESKTLKFQHKFYVE